jgi:hypothetical protein
MDEIRLPQHVLTRFQRRWTAKFAHILADWRRLEHTPPFPACGCYDPLQSRQVRRLLEGSLRPPTRIELSS